MNPEQLARLYVLVGALGEAFNRAISKATLEAYRIGLSDLPYEAVALAVQNSLRTSRFMPTPAELRELAGEVQGKDRGVLAWDTVLRSIGLGAYKHVTFSDGVINATIRSLGGWPTFISRYASAEDEKWLRKEFVETYAVQCKRPLSAEAAAPLPGLLEKQVRNGQVVDAEPVLICVDYPVENLGYQPLRPHLQAAGVPVPMLTLQKP